MHSLQWLSLCTGCADASCSHSRLLACSALTLLPGRAASLYAEQVMELLDPSREYFGARIIAADEENNASMVSKQQQRRCHSVSAPIRHQLLCWLQPPHPLALLPDDDDAVSRRDASEQFE
jgi:hypothetical protein